MPATNAPTPSTLSNELNETVNDNPELKSIACFACDRVFKIGDRVAIESETENRFHFKCWGHGKGRKPAMFVGLHFEKDSKPSSVDRARIASRMKKIKRQLKKRSK